MPEYRSKTPSSSKATILDKYSHADDVINAKEPTITSSVKGILGKLKQPIEPIENMTGRLRQLIEPKPRWCPPGLTRSQKRRLQRLRTAELREISCKIARDEACNELRPMTSRSEVAPPTQNHHGRSGGQSRDLHQRARMGVMSYRILLPYTMEFRRHRRPSSK